jgi:prepilin-type processing-associated H-X9-DG protein
MNGWLSTTSEPTMPRLRVESGTSTVLMGEQGDDKSELRPDSIRAYFGGGDPLKSKDNGAHFLFCDGRVEMKKREVFDPGVSTITPSAIDSATLNPSFSFVPHVGALQD